MNLINILFMQLTFVIVILGTLMNLVEKYLPAFIKQSFRYGKHAHKENPDKLVEKIEIPKAWFSHFYVFAIFWSWISLMLAVGVYFFDYQPHSYIINFLDLSCGSDRSVESKTIKSFDCPGLTSILNHFSFIVNHTNSFRFDDSSMYKKIYRKQLSPNIFKEEQD